LYCWLCLKAGTGKTTLVRFIIDALGVDENRDVAYVAYTGKAATVLKEKGCANATTAHKLLYYSKLMPNGKYFYSPRKVLEYPYKVIVVDEVSMLPIEMWNLLLSHKIYVLACGDPAQLSPIDRKADNHVLDNPHIFLNEVMRQAQESEIIRLTMDIRAGKEIKPFVGKEVQVLNRKDFVDGMYTWADQILCATNATRNGINAYVRNKLGFDEEPQKGDKIICLKNHWDIMSNYDFALTNGQIGYLSDYTTGSLFYPKSIIDKPVKYLLANFELENNELYNNLLIDYDNLNLGKRNITPEQEYKIYTNKNLSNLPIEFAYGYAITVWKAQGSEWDKILAFEENFPYGGEHQKYLYTACTRASDKLVLILKE
jgi:exodeoxyribonuclease-5